MARTLMTEAEKSRDKARRTGKHKRKLQRRRIDENEIENSGEAHQLSGIRQHGAHHKGEQLNKWSEENMRKAILEFNTQKNSVESTIPLRQIARMWSVPYATFRKRVVQQSTLNNHQHRSGRPTVLSIAEEQQLAEHIRALASAGFPCSRKDVRGLAFEYGKIRGYSGLSKLNSSAGYAWFKGFMKRHTNLTIKKAENLSIARAMSMNRVQITNWFTKYKNLCTDLGLTQTPSHIWNVDETGCQNIHKADKVLGEVGKAVYNVTAVERGETSTALVCINAVGSVPPPMIIHKGKQIGKQWKNGARHGVMIRTSDSGYINKELFTEFGQSFIAFINNTGLKDGLPHLLTMDSHYSHLYNLDFLQLMKDNNIHVFALPPHCSHWLQPLDRGVFRSFKQGWQNAMRAYTRDTAGRKLEKKDFFLVFNQAWDYGITVENAQGGFRGSGLFPINPDAIPDHAYDPSSVTERPLPQDTSTDGPSTSGTLNNPAEESENRVSFNNRKFTKIIFIQFTLGYTYAW
jgi:DDE superfamily endonuclease/Tc5 transposase DNA-binding domain